MKLSDCANYQDIVSAMSEIMEISNSAGWKSDFDQIVEILNEYFDISRVSMAEVVVMLLDDCNQAITDQDKVIHILVKYFGVPKNKINYKERSKIMVIAIDFDGTITDKNVFPQIGEMKEYALEAIHNLQAAGNKIVLWTCREGKYLDDARKWLNEHGIDLDCYNYSPYQLQSRKIVADVYIDDKNVFMVDNVDWHKIEEYILNLTNRNAVIYSGV